MDNAGYVLDCLPIIAAQYLISLRHPSFLVPVGIGCVVWIGALASVSWQYSHLIPYAYSMLHFLSGEARMRVSVPAAGLHVYAAGYFVAFTLLGLLLYVSNPDKS